MTIQPFPIPALIRINVQKKRKISLWVEAQGLPQAFAPYAIHLY